MQHWPRRRVLAWLAGAGIGTLAFQRAFAAEAEGKTAVTPEMLDQAEWIAGIDLTEEERALMAEGVGDLLDAYRALRAVPLDNSVAPALRFEVLPLRTPRTLPSPSVRPIDPPFKRPASDEELGFCDLPRLGAFLRSRQLSSVELTRLYLERLERHDADLACVITRTDELALRQAERADRELAAGRDRGPLHGIPWGAKDLLAVPGYPTTWGATPYREQVRSETATVVRKLEQAGAVLVAKLTLGALAWGDVWFGGKTKNPWNPEQGSSGSSAGSASATAAGLVGFAIGSETWGSIVSPCTRCGATGLRPTFGRVSRHGAMALSWSMDKLGPIARSVEDCARVFQAIHGADGLDPTAVDRPFDWPARVDPRKLRVGYVPALFEDSSPHDLATLEKLREIGIRPVEVELPADIPVSSLSFVLTAEAATAFDDLTRDGRDDQLVRQIANAWPNVFRQGQTIPAVEYLRANRIRRLLMERTERALADVDLFVAPSFGGNHLLHTNLTGHPSVVLPNGFREDGTPTSITFTGRLWGESALLAVARAYQQATDFHLRRPPIDDEESSR